MASRAKCAGSLRPGDPTDQTADMSSTPANADSAVRRFAESLTSEERMLVVLKRELYEGSWQEMEADLKARLEGRPYIFKLAHRITNDLERIEKLRKFEGAHGVDLSDYVRMS